MSKDNLASRPDSEDADERTIPIMVSLPRKTHRALQMSARYFETTEALVARFYTRIGLHLQEWITNYNISPGDYTVFTVGENGLVSMNIPEQPDQSPSRNILTLSIPLTQNDFKDLLDKQPQLENEGVDRTVCRFLALGMRFHAETLSGNLNDWQMLIADINIG